MQSEGLKVDLLLPFEKCQRWDWHGLERKYLSRAELRRGNPSPARVAPGLWSPEGIPSASGDFGIQ